VRLWELKRLSESAGLSCEVEDEASGSMHAVVNGVLAHTPNRPICLPMSGVTFLLRADTS